MKSPSLPRSEIRDVLVVGGGLSATALLTALRADGFTGQITVVGDEPPYDRPPLSKELFTRSGPADLRAQFSVDDDAATWLTGLRATAIAGREVTLADDAGHVSTRAADAVVLALGARPIVPQGWDGVRTLSRWPDARFLREALAPGSHLVVAGAGWIGLELASCATLAGVRVTVVEDTGRPLGRLVPAAVGQRIASWLAEVRLLPGRVATGATSHLVLTDGREVNGDVVVAALGSAPATEWLPAAWLGPGGHVRTDRSGDVPDAPGVWAIGDCAVTDRAGQHWNAAVASAERCARALLGQEVPAVPPPTVFSSMFGHQVDLIGHGSPDLEVLWRDDGGWTALLVDGGALRGAVVVDRPRDVAALRRALAAGGAPTLDRDAAVDVRRRLAEVLRRR